MSNPTFHEWLANAFSEYSVHLRKNGDNAQAHYRFIPNHLHSVRPDIHDHLHGDEVDCYHTGDLGKYLVEVRKLWDVPQVFDVEAHKELIRKLLVQVEYTPGNRYSDHAWATGPKVSGCDTHDQTFITERDEDLLRQIMRMTS